MQAELDIFHLLAQHQFACFNFVQYMAQLRQFACRRIVKFKHFADFFQRKSQTFAAQNQFKTRVITLTVQAIATIAFWVEQAFAFVKADGAGGDIKLFGQFRNGIKFLTMVVTRVQRIAAQETVAEYLG